MTLDPQIPPEIAGQLLGPLSIESTQSFCGHGLSGAKVWKCLSSSHGPLCLRQWPTSHPTEQRLAFMHAAMRFARARGLSFVPELHGAAGKSSYKVRDHLWEITQWMPGQADYVQRPEREKLWSAIDALAVLHRTWFDFSNHPAVHSPAVTQRIEMLERWLGERELVDKTGRCVRDNHEVSMCLETVKVLQLHGPRLLHALKQIAGQRIIQQPVLRDIWSDHVLFADQRVAGIIDYGAMNVDERATDLARMLGSLEPFDEELRRQAVMRYNERNLNYSVKDYSVDWERVDLLDRSGSLLTALQWMQWLVLERRLFAVEANQLVERWQRALARILVA